MRNRAINLKAVTQHSKRIFSISQPVPQGVINLLLQKSKRQLSQKQQRQIFDQLRDKNIFPVLVNPKTFSEFCVQISAQFHKTGQILEPSDSCYVCLDGAIKIFQQIKVQDNQKQKQTQKNANELNQPDRIQNLSKFESQNIRLSLGASPVLTQQTQLQRIQKQKIQMGEVLIFQQSQKNVLYIVSSNVILLKIPYNVYYTISLSTFMVEFKKKQQFFISIPLFQRHYRSSLEDFVNSLQQVTCGFGKRIFKEGEKIQNIYIVKQGEFILQKYVSTDDIIVKQGKVTRVKTQGNQSIIQSQIKNHSKHFRACPYKIVSQKQILGECEYVLNKGVYIHSMRCHKEGSKLYFIKADLFFKKLYVSQNGVQRANKIIQQNYQIRKKQIQQGVKFNQQNLLVLKFMPNNTMKHISPIIYPKDKKSFSTNSYQKQRVNNSTQRSTTFFESLNKTIINQNKKTFRKRSESKNNERNTNQYNKKVFKTPAIVQEVVHIVNQKKAYHRLRNIGMQRTNAFQFDINNVPPYIKKKYCHLFQRKKK